MRDSLVPIAEALADLPGPVKAIRDASPQARHHFTVADQVEQLVTASEADPERGFMARLMVLCCLPRTNPGSRAMNPRSGSASLAPTKLVHLIGLGEVVQRLGEASRVAFTGPSRLPEASPTGTNPPRLRSMAYSPTPVRQDYGPTRGLMTSERKSEALPLACDGLVEQAEDGSSQDGDQRPDNTL